MHILILGGTTEANELSALLAQHPHIKATLSYAGRTQNPTLPTIPCRIGGFGGVAGLAAWIREHSVSAVIDATHPFASIMPFNAASACQQTGIPLLALTRPEWKPEQGDNWQQVQNHHEVLNTLGQPPQRIFLTVGRLEIDRYAAAPQHFYIARTIDPVAPQPLPNAVWLTGRGPFTVEGERELLKNHNATVVVTKNSGGKATKAKLIAARELGLPVIMVARPPKPDVKTTHSAAQAMEWIARTHKASL